MGTVYNVNSGHSGRKRSDQSAEHVDAVRESVLQSPRKSVRCLSAETIIPRSLLHHILCVHIRPVRSGPVQVFSEAQ